MTPLGKFLPIVGQPDPAQPKNVHLVGRYAIGVTWADDHGSIYPFEPPAPRRSDREDDRRGRAPRRR